MTLTCRSSNSATTEKGFELEWQACEAKVSGQDGMLPTYLVVARFPSHSGTRGQAFHKYSRNYAIGPTVRIQAVYLPDLLSAGLSTDRETTKKSNWLRP